MGKVIYDERLSAMTKAQIKNGIINELIAERDEIESIVVVAFTDANTAYLVHSGDNEELALASQVIEKVGNGELKADIIKQAADLPPLSSNEMSKVLKKLSDSISKED